MPNWCDNFLTITGPEADIERLRNECFTDDNLDFEKVLPTPEFGPTDRYDSQKLWFMPNHTAIGEGCWYYWRVDHWGTKWEASESQTDFAETQIETGFVTAWSPPIGIFDTLRGRYPTLHFDARYFEIGNGFAGTYEHGVVTEFDHDDEEYRLIGESFGQDFEDEEDKGNN